EGAVEGTLADGVGLEHTSDLTAQLRVAGTYLVQIGRVFRRRLLDRRQEDLTQLVESRIHGTVPLPFIRAKNSGVFLTQWKKKRESATQTVDGRSDRAVGRIEIRPTRHRGRGRRDDHAPRRGRRSSGGRRWRTTSPSPRRPAPSTGRRNSAA